MRWAAAFAACGLLFFAGCGGSSSSGSGSNAGSSPQAPKASPGGPYAGTAGAAITFNGSGSSDPQGQALTLSWDFGDGTTGTGLNPTHTYPVVGQGPTTYNVSLTVRNTSGLSNQATTMAVIQGIAGLTDGKLTGVVMTGTKPILGARVYLFAAGSSGYGLASVSLLAVAQTGTSDATGAYVTTGSGGTFSMSGDYTCTATQQLYIYAVGGNSGSGSNSASGLLAAIGTCPSSTGPSTFAWVNEVSTVATAYALAGFATDATHVSSSAATSPLAQTGIANAFANAANLETLSTGVALAATPAGSGVAPQAEINSLANILESCIDPSNSVANSCNLLFTNALSGGLTGNAPTETASAAFNIAHNPAINVTSLFQIPITTPTYTPVLSRNPTDFTVAIGFSGGGMSGPQGIALDGAGNVWVANVTNSSVTKLSHTGAVLSGAGGYTGSGISSPNGIAIDATGNAWIANGAGSVTELSNSGAILSGATGYTVGGLNQPKAIAIDGSGNAWVANFGANTVTELSSSGAALSGAGFTGGGLNHAVGIAIDGAGSAWVTNQSGNSVTKLSRTGAVLSGANGFTGGGLNTPFGIALSNIGTAWITNGNNGSATLINNSGSSLANAATSGVAASEGVAIDGSGSIWVVNPNTNTLTVLANSSGVLSGPDGYTSSTLNQAQGIAIDGSGDAWVTNTAGNSVTEFVGAAAPVVTPIAAGLPATPTTGSSNLGTLP